MLLHRTLRRLILKRVTIDANELPETRELEHKVKIVGTHIFETYKHCIKNCNQITSKHT